MTFVLSKLRGTSVYADLAAKCRSHSVMFSSIPDLGEGGSGVFARYKSLCGILSATHVMADSIETRFIFSPLLRTLDPTLFLTVQFPIRRILHLETPEGLSALQGGNWPSGALDVCFIEIKRPVFDILLRISGKQAVDLFEHKEKYRLNRDKYSSVDHNSGWCWAADGAPREGAEHNDQRILESKFDGLYVCGGAKDGSTYKTDYLTLVREPFDGEADRGKYDLGPTMDTLPEHFGGISGAGMWQVSFGGSHGTPELINEMFFCGICVSGIDRRHLSSRGPSSLYDIFTPYLDTVIPT